MRPGTQDSASPRTLISFFPIKSVQTTSSLKGDISYLHEGKKRKERYHICMRVKRKSIPERECERICKT